ncbi:MAG: hypothetical protein Q4C42_11140 [Clostridia bacterium]|nr:hypothetical protein [Clostridia bacterium]
MENKELKEGMLPEEELEKIAGGTDETETRVPDDFIVGNKRVTKFDDQGRAIQWSREYGNHYRIFHYECPDCKGFMHLGTMDAVYCDSCNSYYLFTAGKRIVIDEIVFK